MVHESQEGARVDDETVRRRVHKARPLPTVRESEVGCAIMTDEADALTRAIADWLRLVAHMEDLVEMSRMQAKAKAADERGDSDEEDLGLN